MHWTEDIDELDRMRREWLIAVDDHNRLLRGIASALGLTTIGLLIYIVASLLVRSCH